MVIAVWVTARSESLEKFEQVLREVVAEARGEAGCGRYDWYRAPGAEREFFIYAEFDSDEAFAAYRQGPVVKKIGEQVIPLLEARPSFKHLRATVLEQG